MLDLSLTDAAKALEQANLVHINIDETCFTYCYRYFDYLNDSQQPVRVIQLGLLPIISKVQEVQVELPSLNVSSVYHGDLGR